MGAASAAAQTPDRLKELADRRAEAFVSADERNLWLAWVGGTQSRLFHQGAGRSFGEGVVVNDPIAAMAAAGDELFVFFENHATPYRYFEGGARPEAKLSADRRPVDIVAEDGTLYALAPAEIAADLPRSLTATAPAFEAGEAALGIFAYNGQRWSPLVACPLDVRFNAGAAPRLRPRLCASKETVFLFWTGDSGSQLHYVMYQPQTGAVRTTGTLGAPRRLAAFWALFVGRTLTVVLLMDNAEEGRSWLVYRLLGDPAQEGAAAWRAVDRKNLYFAPPFAEKIQSEQWRDAFGFNGHLGFLVTDANGQAHLTFAQIGAAPTLPSISVTDVLNKGQLVRQVYRPLQMLMFLVFLGILTGLFLFRRGSMFQTLVLPVPWGPALVFQRLGAFLIDFLPCTLLAAFWWKTPWLEGLRQVMAWAVGPEASQGGLPTPDILVWWGLSGGLYAAYALTAELLTRRTFGKILVGVHLLSETGARPASWQIVVRNLARLLELLPPLWPLAFLVVLTRNRQRFGDILARTVPVRRLERLAEREHSAGPDAGPPDQGASGGPPDGAA